MLVEREGARVREQAEDGPLRDAAEAGGRVHAHGAGQGAEDQVSLPSGELSASRLCLPA